MAGLQEWQAILIGYGVLLILSETAAAPLASLMAWGIAITYTFSAFQKGDPLGALFPAQPAGAPPALQNPGQPLVSVPGSINVLPPGAPGSIATGG